MKTVQLSVLKGMGLFALMCFCVLSIVSVYFAFSYRQMTVTDFHVLTGQSDIGPVIERMGPPSEEFLKGQIVEGRGWKAPLRPVEYKVLVFVRRTGMKYYVFVDENGAIMYEFSSSS